MQFDRFYLFGNAHLRGGLHVRSVNQIPDPFAVLKSETVPSSCLVFERASGTRLEDVVGTTHAVLYLVSERLVDALRRHRITGWSTYPVKLLGKGGEPVSGYYGLSVTGRCGSLDDSQSPKVWRAPRVPNGPKYQAWMGLYFPLDTWDGSDVFCPANTGHILVTETVRSVLQGAGVRNVQFTRVTEVERLVL